MSSAGTCLLSTSSSSPLPLPALHAYLLQHAPSIVLPSSSHLTAKEFGFGQSNPTYLISSHSPHSPPIKFVLRRSPTTVIDATAHAVDREYHILNHIHSSPSNTPVPRVYHLSLDRLVMNCKWYVMEYVEGRIFTDPSFKNVPKNDRGAYFSSAVSTLVAIHNVDIDEFTMFSRDGATKPKPGTSRNTVARQIKRLLSVSDKQASVAGSVEGLKQLAEELGRYVRERGSERGQRANVEDHNREQNDCNSAALVPHPSRERSPSPLLPSLAVRLLTGALFLSHHHSQVRGPYADESVGEESFDSWGL